MCGIIAVIRKSSDRKPPDRADLLAGMQDSHAAAADALNVPRSVSEYLERANEQLLAVDRSLRGLSGLSSLLRYPDLLEDLDSGARDLEVVIERIEQGIDAKVFELADLGVEELNARLLRFRDTVWAVRMDRIGHARSVAQLAGAVPSRASVEAFSSVELALSALNRLEVRGRDSAGIHLLVSGHGLDLDDPDVAVELQRRAERSFRDGAVRCPSGHLCFVYKVAREVGELGDNTRSLRSAIADDHLLRAALEHDGAKVTVLGHTRWASVGLINLANAHPVNQEEENGLDGPYVVAALNGDVDNYRDLIAQHSISIPPGITTDAKVIPSLVSRGIASGLSCEEAFRRTADHLDGSVAIAAVAADEPSKLLLALRGSGQTLCVGIADDAYVVASEPYGVVEATAAYVRMDGELISHADGSHGQVVILDADKAGTPEGMRRLTYGGVDLPVGASDVLTTDITTRDIDRGHHRHFLLKEITESPTTMHKTLRGRVHDVDGRKCVRFGEDSFPKSLRSRLDTGAVRRIVVVGQGTAAVAGTGVAASIRAALRLAPIDVTAEPASELSAFGLKEDMSDTLVVAVSQSGTTTDTNRTVDLARARGAAVIAIVNRRNSDLTHKADGVIYTSDGRDIEMSVASTKAFYSQIAAGVLLSFALADAIGCPDTDAQEELLSSLASLPKAMDEVLAKRTEIGTLAHEFAPRRRHWAIVGNGRNAIAANEIRIKMSELCYKSIALDITEDKKHIDLSCEPLTLVCACGLGGSAAADVAKEVAIFRAHKGVPIVIATTGAEAFSGDANVITVPRVHDDLAFLLSTMVGHLFGYEAALAIDAQALPLREARAAIDAAAQHAPDSDALLRRLRSALAPHIEAYRQRLWAGFYDSTLAPGVTARLASLFSYIEGATPLDYYDREFGRAGTPSNLVEDLTSALTLAIDDLTRPIDTIRHQAKTVTVGISRSEEELFTVPLVASVIEAGGAREGLTYLNLRTLAALNLAVSEVTGYSRYQIERSPERHEASIAMVASGGSVEGAHSRTRTDPMLRGTKKLVAEEREVLIARGRGDGRLVAFVPEVTAGRTTGMVLLHIRLHERLDPKRMRRVLDGYRHRLAALTSAVIESESNFDEQRLETIGVESLLTSPINILADAWVQPDATISRADTAVIPDGVRARPEDGAGSLKPSR